MEKLPRKEELLPKQHTELPTPKIAGDNSSTVVAKEAADIAISKDKQVEAEIRTKLRQQGYESLEEGLKDIEAKKKEANAMLESARQIEESAVSIRDEAEKEKGKAIHALEILKQREETINHRLEKAIKVETGVKNTDEKYTALQQELQELILYHQTNIKPCVKSLRAVSKIIYSWIDLLNDTKYDFGLLYNYIGKVTRIIDRYVDKMPMTISDDISKDEG